MTTPDQEPIEGRPFSRRRVLGAGVGVAAAALLAACGKNSDSADLAATAGQAATGDSAAATTAAPTTTTLAATPTCADDDETPALTEGPYFKRSSPEKSNLFADVNTGTRLTVTGRVLSTTCAAVNAALIDVWQADAAGNYDNSGYTLRGHLFTDTQGRYSFTTVVPGLYPGRTRHIHVKVQAPNGPILTTQLFFPGEARNTGDSIYRKECELAVSDVSGGKAATFDFVIDT